MNIQLHGAYIHNAGDVQMMRAASNRLIGKYAITISSERDTRPDVLMDICGYWLGDPWMPTRPGVPSKAEQCAHAIQTWKARGTKIILMPQTLGPFTNPLLQAQVRIIADNADLICARDAISLKNLENLCGTRDTFRLYPDYTAEVPAITSHAYDVPPHSIAIIPNMRMIDRATPERAQKYLNFLHRCAQSITERGMNYFILPHEEHDRTLANNIAEELGGAVHVAQEQDAQAIRGIIRQCTAIIGSRYHGILGAFYQGIPAIGTSWNHKFDELFRVYGYEDLLVNPDDSHERLEAALDRICNPDERMLITKQLLLVTEKQQKAVDRLWMDIDSILSRTPAFT